MDIFFALIELLGWVGALVWAATAIKRRRGWGHYDAPPPLPTA